ncbi:MAG TPA: hypothetical protein VKY24_21195 [Reyranella sp.]|nr:hypothetical protein [Reyranella sp.]
MFRSKLRLYTIFVAVGASLAAVAPYAARAQEPEYSGDALAQAEHTCLDQGIGPYSVTFDTCTERAASAYDQGAPDLAVTEAHRVAEAQQACMSYDLDPQTLGYHRCIAHETDRPTAERPAQALRY